MAAYAYVSQQTTRRRAMRPAEPLSDRATACLGFLTRVTSVKITSGSKKEFEIHVQLVATYDGEATPSAFGIRRTANDIAALQRVIVDVCDQHPSLAAYGIAPCALCEPFRRLKPLPTKTMDRVCHSERSIQQTFAERLERFVRGALVPPTIVDLFCEAHEKMPIAVARFLLRDVDQSQL